MLNPRIRCPIYMLLQAASREKTCRCIAPSPHTATSLPPPPPCPTLGGGGRGRQQVTDLRGLVLGHLAADDLAAVRLTSRAAPAAVHCTCATWEPDSRACSTERLCALAGAVLVIWR